MPQKPDHTKLAEQLAAIAVCDTTGHIEAATALMVATHLVFRFAGRLSLGEPEMTLFASMSELAEIIALEWEAAGAPIPSQRKN